MTRTISPEALAAIGGGKIAYVKAIRSEDLNTLFPQAPQLAPGMQLFALHAADGTPSWWPTLARRQWRTPGTTSSKPSACTNRKQIGKQGERPAWSAPSPQAARGGGNVSTA